MKIRDLYNDASWIIVTSLKKSEPMPRKARHYRIIKYGREAEYYMRPPYGMNLKYCNRCGG
ncbi:hypothetical protein [Acinetobacter phage Ab69]|nr:hypothetical protein [Acinetobacter phage Ab69]